MLLQYEKVCFNNQEESKKFAQDFAEKFWPPISRRNLDITRVVLALIGDLGSGRQLSPKLLPSDWGERKNKKPDLHNI